MPSHINHVARLAKLEALAAQVTTETDERHKYERDMLLMMILDESEFGDDAFHRAVNKLRRQDQVTATGFEADFRRALVEDTCFEVELTEGDIDRIVSIAGTSFESVTK